MEKLAMPSITETFTYFVDFQARCGLSDLKIVFK